MNFLWGLIGLVVLGGLAWLISTDRKSISYRTVISALALQILFGFIVLKWDFGQGMFKKLSNFVETIIGASQAGIEFLFGGLIADNGFVFALQVLPIIIFFSSLISVLYHLGIMQWVIRLIGGVLTKLLRTSKLESTAAAANIFLGSFESALVIKPYVERLTKSELFSVMVCGMATVAGSVFAGYAALGIPVEYLLAAALMAAPSGLLFAKIIVPEVKSTEVQQLEIKNERVSKNIFDAAAIGASDGMRLALTIAAMLIAFTSLIALINVIIAPVGSLFGNPNLTLETIFGYLFAPLAFVIGIPIDEIIGGGYFIGIKFSVNEFVAFTEFSKHLHEYSDKSIAVISFALCGFANIAGIAGAIGGLGGIAPKRRTEITQLGVRALVAATLANLASAAIAGMFIQ
ncbi:NupC/NupG family nucleoside CNT transporter [Paenibacillus faecalis]|uniref:NupC/NupG family nucleoside CNT transporter n=1 Tax=Paenibacillus faecalis TaxID=2079532 RepID=UPI000D104FE8|nr:NupC/NupG family nucleoside CNT transporter [Paenibacillus faecalis]